MSTPPIDLMSMLAQLINLLVLVSIGTCGFLVWRGLGQSPWPAAHSRNLMPWPGWLLPATVASWLSISILGMKPTPTASAGADAINAPIIHNSLMHLALFVFLIALIEAARHNANYYTTETTDMANAHSWSWRNSTSNAQPLARQLLYGIVGFLACLLPTLIVFQATLPFRPENLMHPLLKLIGEDKTGQVLITVTISAVLVAPWVEELMFRVILQRTLLNHLSPSCSILLTALAFCAIHPSWQDAVGLAPLALVLGVTYHRTGSFLAVVVIHMLFNAYNILSMMIESAAA
ncbi:MAG: CPBP family intramembrane glutamic endopeptidase [Planctomycetaceae bacterium]